jgi:hypothetical protein
MSTGKKKTSKKKPMKGLGDAVERVTEATGIKAVVKFIAGEDCGCDERKELLNRLIPFKGSDPNCMSEEEHTWWTGFQAGDVEFMTNAEAQKVAHMHSRIFNHELYTPCKCTPAKWQKMIDDVNEVYKTYGE